MKVSIQLTKTAHSSSAAKISFLRDIDLDTALAIGAALRDLPNADVEAVIVVENLPTSARPARKPQAAPARTGLTSWLRGLAPLALAR